MRVSLGTWCKIEVFGESLNIEKLIPKGVPKTIKNRAKNDLRSDF